MVTKKEIRKSFRDSIPEKRCVIGGKRNYLKMENEE